MAKTYKLTKEEIKKWQRRIDISREWRHPHAERWRTNLDNLCGYLIEKEDVQEDINQVTINLVYAFARTVIPNIYSRNPDLLLEARQRVNDQAADCVKAVVQYFLEELDSKRELKLCLLDYIMCGHAWIKTGYEFDTEKDEPDEDGDEEQKTILGTLKEKIKELTSRLTGADKEDIANSYILNDERIRVDSPFIQRVSPFNILVPIFSERPETLCWIAELMIVPTWDVRNNPEYENNKNIPPSALALDLLQNRRGNQGGKGDDLDDEEGFNLLYKIYDSRTRTNFIIADDYDKPLQQPQTDDTYDYRDTKFPFRMLRNTEVSDEFYPLDDISAWRAQMREKNLIRTLQSKHIQGFTNRKWATTATSSDIRSALLSNKDEVVVVDGEDVNKEIRLLEHPQIPTDLFAVEEKIDKDIDRISNVNAYQQGDVQGGAKTATEAAIIETSSRARINEQLDVVGDFACKIARDLGQICLKYLDVKQIAEIVGTETAVNWPKLPDAMIKKEFIYKAVFGSSKITSPEVERQQFGEFMMRYNNDPRVDQNWLIGEDFRKQGIMDATSKLDPKVAQALKDYNMNSIMQQLYQPQNPLVDQYGQPTASQSQGGVNGTNISAGPASEASIRSGIRRPYGRQGNALIQP